MRQHKLTVIGSGSTYSPEIFEGIINRKEMLNLKRVSLMDIDERKLEIVGGLIKRMLTAGGIDAEVEMTTDLDRALDGADYVIAQIRVGRLPARVLDERIPLKYGLIGQETTGIGGFFKGLRTIPQIMNVAKKMEKLCPNAVLINFSNPSGLVAEAVQNNSSIAMTGLCNIPINMLTDVKKHLGYEADVTYFGLNHLSWISSVKKDGVELMPELMENYEAEDIPKKFCRLAGGFPCGYLQYYYTRRHKLEELTEKAKNKTRGEECMEIEEQLLELFSDASLYVKPEQLSKRGGALYSEAAISLLNAIENKLPEFHIVNVKNNGALPWMADDDIVETKVLVQGKEFIPVPVRGFENAHIKNMMRTVKAYEKHAAKAALTGDKDEAIRAMLVHPLIGDGDAAIACFEEMLEAHKDYLPQFFA
ncbi:MAG: 6-phospho-beta-glucosidase [Clostridia bacterium]|nr:6-phospho-beta-glucosidase [Clostridia bacterium]